jgi:hypothetical protein
LPRSSESSPNVRRRLGPWRVSRIQGRVHCIMIKVRFHVIEFVDTEDRLA